jgi:hypothetical protein
MRIAALAAAAVLAAAVVVAAPPAATAQTVVSPGQARPPLPLPPDLVDSLYGYLINGGTHDAGANLARLLVGVAKDQQRDLEMAQLRQQLEAARKAAAPAPTPPAAATAPAPAAPATQPSTDESVKP